MLVLRPANLPDLPALEAIAGASAIGITSLAKDRDKLHEKIRASLHSFASDVDVNGEEQYLFVLEDTDRGVLAGTAGITASAGFHDRFYSYRNEIIVHASQELGVSNKIRSLHLCHDLTGHSLLTAFYLDPALGRTGWPQLLSRGRLLFIAEHPRRFDDRLAAESPGVCDDAGNSPFWNAVGRRFFAMDYPQAERLSGGRSKTFIAELMPQYPLYVPLLPPEARLAIGQLHPVAELPFSILVAEGFEADTYIDIFDGGPTVHARLSALVTMRSNRRLRVAGGSPPAPGTPHLVANTATEGFRATLADLAPAGDAVCLPREVADVLGVGEGDDVRVAPL